MPTHRVGFPQVPRSRTDAASAAAAPARRYPADRAPRRRDPLLVVRRRSGRIRPRRSLSQVTGQRPYRRSVPSQIMMIAREIPHGVHRSCAVQRAPRTSQAASRSGAFHFVPLAITRDRTRPFRRFQTLSRRLSLETSRPLGKETRGVCRFRP